MGEPTKDTRRSPGAITPPPPDALRWAAAFVLAVCVFFAASVGIVRFPYWDLDPTRVWVPSTGLTPAQTLLLAALTLLAAAGAMLADAMDGRRVLWGRASLAGLGGVGVLLHATGPAGLEHAALAAPWLGAMGAWIAAAQLSTDRTMRRMLLATAAGFVVVLLSKGLIQVFVEHPQTMANFRQNREAVLASKGWTPGSPNALAYERRLSQPEATGWFGLSNVYATFAAASAAGLLAAGIAAAAAAAAKKTRDRPGLWAAATGAAAGIAALVLCGSKGGAGAAVVTLGLVGGFVMLRRQQPKTANRLAPWIGPGAVVGVLAAVALRGMLGESIGERSLLFRAFYAVGALRIWGAHPLLGVGPAGFQDAYASAKPPLSPEDVMSPHSVLLDWVSTLGLFGLAWAALFFRHAAELFNPNGDPETAPAGVTRAEIRWVALVAAGVTVLGVAIERPLMTPDAAAARLAAMGAWIAVTLGVRRLLDTTGTTRWLAAASGLVLIVHAQIEVTPVWINAAMLYGLWLGAASTPGRPKGIPGAVPHRLAGGATLVPVGLAAGLLMLGWPGLTRWEDRLEQAAAVVRPVARLSESLEKADDHALDAPAERASSLVGRRVRPNREAIARAISEARFDRLEKAAADLAGAIEARPAHRGTRAAAGRLLLEKASAVARHNPAEARALLHRTVDLAETGTRADPGSVGMWDWLAVTCEQAAAIDRKNAARWLARAERAWIERDRRSPHALRPAVHLMNLAERTGRTREARRWAAEVLRRETLTRLDPLMGLSERERARAERLAGGG